MVLSPPVLLKASDLSGAEEMEPKSDTSASEVGVLLPVGVAVEQLAVPSDFSSAVTASTNPQTMVTR